MSEKLDINTLTDFFINSVDETKSPKWTEEHISELLYNFDVYEKDEADKMFEELGYKKIVEREYKEPENKEEGVIELILYRDEIKYLEISFWNDRTISKENNYDMSYLTIKELQAINKKCEELGWI